jgi:hypothetical protein
MFEHENPQGKFRVSGLARILRNNRLCDERKERLKLKVFGKIATKLEDL